MLTVSWPETANAGKTYVVKVCRVGRTFFRADLSEVNHVGLVGHQGDGQIERVQHGLFYSPHVIKRSSICNGEHHHQSVRPIVNVVRRQFLVVL